MLEFDWSQDWNRYWEIDKDSLAIVCSRIQASSINVYDGEGRLIISKKYARDGNLAIEKIFQPDCNTSTEIKYYKNGKVESIEFWKKGIYPNKMHSFDEEGRLKPPEY